MNYQQVQNRIFKMVDDLGQKAESRDVFVALCYAAALIVIPGKMPKQMFLHGAGLAFDDAVENLAKEKKDRG